MLKKRFLLLAIILIAFPVFLLLDKSDFAIAGAGVIQYVKIKKDTANGPSTLESDVSIGSLYGTASVGIGDLNDDGVEDIAVGAYRHDAAAGYPGALFIHFMNTDGSIDSTSMIEHDTANGPSFSVGVNDYGIAAEGIGDLNSDGVEDIAVGAPLKDVGSNDGAVFIHFMNTNGTLDSTVEINDLTANGATLSGSTAYGGAIANIGDLNDDGVTDIAVGAVGVGTSKGAVFIHFMNTDGSIDSTVELNTSTVTGLNLVNDDRYGSGISGIGDFNNDNVEDIAIGAVGRNTGEGAVFIHFMNTDGSVDSVVEIEDGVTNGPSLDFNDFYGANIANIGDLNIDGVDDIVVASRTDDDAGTDAGAFYVHFMNSDGSIDRTSKVSALRNNAPPVTTFKGYAFSLDNIGDLNNDGVNDLLVGSYFDDEEGSRTGAAYILFMELTPDIVFTESGGSTNVGEDGTTDTITVALETLQPTSDVTITISTGSQLSVNDTTLVFTTLNWDTPQVITVSAIDDAVVEGDHTGTLSYTIDSLDSKYDEYELLADTTVNIEDNDPGLLVTFATGSVIEMTTPDTMSVSLLTPPSGNVTVTLAPDGELFLSETTLTFTTLNWSTPQDVMVHGIDEGVTEGAHTGVITLTTTSSDSNYQGIEEEETVDIDDGVGGGIIFNPTYGPTDTTTEGDVGALGDLTLTFDPNTIDPINPPTIVITATPNAQVDLGAGAGIAVDFTFDPLGFWFDTQFITGTIVDDAIPEGEHQAVITFSVDPIYYGIITPNPYTFLILDDDPGVVVTESSGTTAVTEGGATDTFEVVMSTLPTGNVVVTITNDAEVSLSTNTLTFTTLNWDTPQTVTVTAVNDDIVEALMLVIVEFSSASSDGNYNNFSISDMSVSITDNDAQIEPGQGSYGSSSYGSRTPNIRAKGKITETNSRFLDLETFTPGSVVYFEISNTPDFSVKETYVREYTQKDLYWDMCKGLTNCAPGPKRVYARFYSQFKMIKEQYIEINYNMEKGCPFFNGYLRKGSIKNNPLEVIKAQEFLNREMEAGLIVDGIFGEETEIAVKNFQSKYPTEIIFPWPTLKKSTGFWYITTSAYANLLMGC